MLYGRRWGEVRDEGTTDKNEDNAQCKHMIKY